MRKRAYAFCLYVSTHVQTANKETQRFACRWWQLLEIAEENDVDVAKIVIAIRQPTVPFALLERCVDRSESFDVDHGHLFQALLYLLSACSPPIRAEDKDL